LVSYTQIPSLAEYVLVAQDRVEVTVFRCANQWQPEASSLPNQFLELKSLAFRGPLGALYEGV
jgi:Uma2 family endonuclease